MRVSTETFKALTTRPPVLVRVLGAFLLTYDVVMWDREGTPVSALELAKHSILLVVALTLVYPEGARIVTSFLRKNVPLLDRRRKR